jgi:hypothetical protein
MLHSSGSTFAIVPPEDVVVSCCSYMLHKRMSQIKSVYSLFNDAFSMAQTTYTASDEGMISEWWIGKDVEGTGHGLILTYYPGICLEGLRKPTKNRSQDSWSPGWDLNPEPSKYKGVLTTRPWHSVSQDYCTLWQTLCNASSFRKTRK